MITRRRLFAVPVGLLAMAIAPRSPAAVPPLRIVTSFSILDDMVRSVVGGDFDITSLVAPDADAHLFEPRPADAVRLAEADLIVVNGLGFEGWLDRLVLASGSKARVVVASAGVVPRTLEGHPDPHAWQDLGNGARYVRNIVGPLAALRPSRATRWRANADACLDAIQALDRTVRARFAAIPRARRRVMTSHDAFGYFGAAYGVDFISPLGMSTDGEASAATVARLIRQIREQDIHALFVENVMDPRLVERIAAEAGVPVGGRLYSDALSPPGSEADTYLKLFAHNASAIAAALEAAR